MLTKTLKSTWYIVSAQKYRVQTSLVAQCKNLPASAGDTGSVPGLGRCHMLRSKEVWATEPMCCDYRVAPICHN